LELKAEETQIVVEETKELTRGKEASEVIA
jgi:hypothetical protein